MSDVGFDLDGGITLDVKPTWAFQIPTNDPSKDLFSRLLFNVSIWEWLTFDNGDTNTIIPPNNVP